MRESQPYHHDKVSASRSKKESAEKKSEPSAKVGPIDRSDDQDTILNEVAHFADRDAMALEGHKIIQGGSNADIDDDWSYDRKDSLKGDSDDSSDAVDAQLQHVAEITESIHDPASHSEPTMARPLDKRDEFDSLTEHELSSLADTLGIPDREHMQRPKLLEKIRASAMRGL